MAYNGNYCQSESRHNAVYCLMINSSILRLRRLKQGKLYYLNPTLVTFAHKTRILNVFEAETSVLFSKLSRYFHVYRNKSLPSIDCFDYCLTSGIDDFWSIL